MSDRLHTLKRRVRIWTWIFIVGLLTIHTGGCSAQSPFSIDNSFNVQYDFNDGITTGAVGGIFEFSSGAIIVHGSFAPPNFFPRQNIVKLFSDGSIDMSFLSINHFSSGNTVSYLLSYGSNYVVNNGSHDIHRIDSSGNEVDLWWNDSLTACITKSFGKPFIFSDGSMFAPCTQCFSPVPSSQAQYYFNFARIDSLGKYDTTFNHDTDLGVDMVLPYDSSRLLLIGGQFYSYDAFHSPRICRIFKTGQIDSSWISDVSWGSIGDIYVQQDGKVIILGRFTISGNQDTTGIARLMPNGSLDTTFNNFNSIQGKSHFGGALCSTDGNGYLVGGAFNKYGGIDRSNIAKINLDGFLDSMYFNGSAIDSIDPISANLGIRPGVRRIIKSSISDKYYVMGTFLKYNSNVVEPIIRIHGLSVGMREDSKPSLLKVFPNPSKGRMTISGIFNLKDGNLVICNQLGQELYNQRLKNYVGGEISIDVSELISGLYYLRLSSEKGVQVGKVVIE